MRRSGSTSLSTRIYVFGFTCLAASSVAAQQAQVIRELKHGVSPELRDLTAGSAAFAAQEDGEDEDGVHGLHIANSAAVVADPVLQRTAGATLKTIPGMNLLGLGEGFRGPNGSRIPGGVPPDSNAAVGATQVVQVVNLSLAVFDKTSGQATYGPVFVGDLWKATYPACSDGTNLADPFITYDKQAQRWVLEIHSLGTPYAICMAVSQTSDASGLYNVYAFGLQANGRLTSPKVSSWPDAYYLSSETNTGAGYLGPLACALDRGQMLAGHAATMQCIQIEDPRLSGMVPSDLDGPVPPPAGSPNYFLLEGPEGSNALYLFRYRVDFANRANSTLIGPLEIDVAPYTASFQVPQLGTSQMLNTNGTGLLSRLAYRNFANATPAYESLVVTHSVVTGSGSNSGVGMRWYELRSPGSSPIVYQQGTYAPDTAYHWMGSAAMDGMGDIAMGYSISTATAYPSIRYTGRVPSDPLGTMEAEGTIMDGSGYQADSDRWGDFTSMSVDPVDDCTMWYTAEYTVGSGSIVWATRLFSFRFAGCQAGASLVHARGEESAIHGYALAGDKTGRIGSQ